MIFLLVKEVSLFLKLSVSVTSPEPRELLVSLLFCLEVTARELLGRDSLKRDLDFSFRLGVFRFIKLRFDLGLRVKGDCIRFLFLKEL